MDTLQAEKNQRRRRLRSPLSMVEVLRESLASIHEASSSRGHRLLPTTLAEEADHYSERSLALGLTGACPSVREEITEEHGEEMARKIDAALTLAEIARAAPREIRSVITYYSCAHLLGVFSRAFFQWKVDKRIHGMKTVFDRDVGHVKVWPMSSGFFPRLETTCFLLWKAPSRFSYLVTCLQKRRRGRGAHPDFHMEERGAPIQWLLVKDLSRFDYKAQGDRLVRRHGDCAGGSWLSHALLVDVLTLYAAGWLARYHVIGWQEILDGKSNDYYLHFEAVSDIYHDFLVDGILALLEEPLHNLTELYPLEEAENPYKYQHERLNMIRPQE